MSPDWYWETVSYDYARNLRDGMLGGCRYDGGWTQLAVVAAKLQEFARHPLPARLHRFVSVVLHAWREQDFAAMRAASY